MRSQDDPLVIEIPEEATLVVAVVLILLLVGGVRWWADRIRGVLP